jgi:hypothetical protein
MLLEQQAASPALPAHAGGGAAAGAEPEPDGAGSARTLASSEFVSVHDPKAAPGYQDEVMGALRNMLDYYCKKRNLPQEPGRVLFERLQKEAFTQGLHPPAACHPCILSATVPRSRPNNARVSLGGGAEEMLDNIASGAQRLWTSGHKLQGVPPAFSKELSSILNEAIREDDRGAPFPAATGSAVAQ